MFAFFFKKRKAGWSRTNNHGITDIVHDSSLTEASRSQVTRAHSDTVASTTSHVHSQEQTHKVDTALGENAAYYTSTPEQYLQNVVAQSTETNETAPVLPKGYHPSYYIGAKVAHEEGVVYGPVLPEGFVFRESQSEQSLSRRKADERSSSSAEYATTVHEGMKVGRSTSEERHSRHEVGRSSSSVTESKAESHVVLDSRTAGHGSTYQGRTGVAISTPETIVLRNESEERSSADTHVVVDSRIAGHGSTTYQERAEVAISTPETIVSGGKSEERSLPSATRFKADTYVVVDSRTAGYKSTSQERSASEEYSRHEVKRSSSASVTESKAETHIALDSQTTGHGSSYQERIEAVTGTPGTIISRNESEGRSLHSATGFKAGTHVVVDSRTAAHGATSQERSASEEYSRHAVERSSSSVAESKTDTHVVVDSRTAEHGPTSQERTGVATSAPEVIVSRNESEERSLRSATGSGAETHVVMDSRTAHGSTSQESSATEGRHSRHEVKRSSASVTESKAEAYVVVDSQTTEHGSAYQDRTEVAISTPETIISRGENEKRLLRSATRFKADTHFTADSRTAAHGSTYHERTDVAMNTPATIVSKDQSEERSSASVTGSKAETHAVDSRTVGHGYTSQERSTSGEFGHEAEQSSASVIESKAETHVVLDSRTAEHGPSFEERAEVVTSTPETIVSRGESEEHSATGFQADTHVVVDSRTVVHGSTSQERSASEERYSSHGVEQSSASVTGSKAGTHVVVDSRTAEHGSSYQDGTEVATSTPEIVSRDESEEWSSPSTTEFSPETHVVLGSRTTQHGSTSRERSESATRTQETIDLRDGSEEQSSHSAIGYASTTQERIEVGKSTSERSLSRHEIEERSAFYDTAARSPSGDVAMTAEHGSASFQEGVEIGSTTSQQNVSRSDIHEQSELRSISQESVTQTSEKRSASREQSEHASHSERASHSEGVVRSDVVEKTTGVSVEDGLPWQASLEFGRSASEQNVPLHESEQKSTSHDFLSTVEQNPATSQEETEIGRSAIEKHHREGDSSSLGLVNEERSASQLEVSVGQTSEERSERRDEMEGGGSHSEDVLKPDFVEITTGTAMQSGLSLQGGLTGSSERTISRQEAVKRSHSEESEFESKSTSQHVVTQSSEAGVSLQEGFDFQFQKNESSRSELRNGESAHSEEEEVVEDGGVDISTPDDGQVGFAWQAEERGRSEEVESRTEKVERSSSFAAESRSEAESTSRDVTSTSQTIEYGPLLPENFEFRSRSEKRMSRHATEQGSSSFSAESRTESAAGFGSTVDTFDGAEYGPALPQGFELRRARTRRRSESATGDSEVTSGSDGVAISPTGTIESGPTTPEGLKFRRSKSERAKQRRSVDEGTSRSAEARHETVARSDVAQTPTSGVPEHRQAFPEGHRLRRSNTERISGGGRSSSHSLDLRSEARASADLTASAQPPPFEPVGTTIVAPPAGHKLRRSATEKISSGRGRPGYAAERPSFSAESGSAVEAVARRGSGE